jgi:uncharacterized membrane protein
MVAIAIADSMAAVELSYCKQESFLLESYMLKSASFGVLHVGIAFGVSYALTGDVAIAGAITLIEPLVNTVAHYFFDRWWGRPALVQRWRTLTGQGRHGLT